MPDIASIFQGIQVGVESTPGTAVAANKRLGSLSITPGAKVEMQKFRPQGRKFMTIGVPGKEWVEAKIAGAMTYTDIVYLLSSVLKTATVTQIIPSTGLAYRWVFAPSSTGPDTVKTLTVEQGSSVRAHRFPYGLVTELSGKWSRKGVELSGSMIGQRIEDNVTITASPTEIALVPVLPTHVDVILADSAAGLDAGTPLSRALAVEWSIGDRYNPIWPLRSNQNSFAGHVESEPKLTAKLLVGADAEGMALLTTMRAGATKFLRIKSQGDLIETGNYYLLQFDTAVKVSEPSEYKDEDGLFAIEWSLDGSDDATWGKALEVTAVNRLSAL